MRLLAVVAGVVAMSSATAAGDGWPGRGYVVLGVAGARMPAYDRAVVGRTAHETREQDRLSAGALVAGGWVSQTGLGGEIGGIFGLKQSAVGTVAVVAGDGAVRISGQVRRQLVWAAGTVSYPWHERLSAHAKLGVARWEAKASGALGPSLVPVGESLDRSGVALLLGVGADVSLTDRLGLRADVMIVPHGDDTIQVVALAARVAF